MQQKLLVAILIVLVCILTISGIMFYQYTNDQRAVQSSLDTVSDKLTDVIETNNVQKETPAALL